MERRAYFWLLACAALGLGASSSSAWVHYRLLNDPRYTSFCDVSSTVNCTEAYLSAYGSLFGTPVALFGMLFFVAVAALLVAGRPGSRLADNAPGYVFVLSTVGLAVVLYLAYGAFFVLRAVCLLCVMTYVAVIGLFVVSGAQTRVPMTSLPQRLLRDLRAALTSPVALAALVVLVAGAASAIAFFPKESTAPSPVAAAAAATAAAPGAAAQGGAADPRSEVEKWFDEQPRAIVPWGDTKGAAVVIVKFNDYQCPPCRMTYESYKPIIAKYQAQAPGKILYMTKDYPMDPECNANTPRGGHVFGCEAAAAVRMARAHQHGDQLEAWIFTNQATLTAEGIRNAAREIGGVTDFDAKYAQTLEQVKTDVATGRLLGVDATPTFFINGVKIAGGLQPQFFDAIIAYELRKAGK